MKIFKRISIILTVIAFPLVSSAQTGFTVEQYSSFLQDNLNLSGDELLSRHSPENIYYNGKSNTVSLNGFSYLDSVMEKYNLTGPETDLLKKNNFVVTERLRFDCFGKALHDIYKNDLPVFVSTDAVLYALHASYDMILKDIEKEILKPQLSEYLTRVSASFNTVYEKYKNVEGLRDALDDVDLYVTIARSLLEDNLRTPKIISSEKTRAVWEAIQAEQMVQMPLFSERNRKLDFSQFTVRGHYTDPYYELQSYFKCMMWLGRIDFLLTPPPENPWEAKWEKEEIRRMNLGAAILNELTETSGAKHLIKNNNEIIDFLIGKSDNITPEEYSGFYSSLNLSGAGDLLNDTVYDNYLTGLTENVNHGQKILSNFFLMDPYSSKPGVLPVSFRLMGQRFIIDSYIFSNVVFDRIVFNGEKIWRPMPDPLDAMFVLGNDDALHLLSNELEKYKYSSQLASLRYLTDAYDKEFWDKSLYNVWLQAIRELNPPADRTGFPFFMKTAAWQQEKLNTQLASWSQLRHDNLLYGKQSYTGGTACSFPHSYVEPYPSFYQQLAAFAEKAGNFFSGYQSDTWMMSSIKNYFPKFKSVVEKLAVIAQKELDGSTFDFAEIEFLQKMLFIENQSGAPPFSGWYSDLFYDPVKAAEGEYLIADVHTQPTDENGAVVGNILHVGTGRINLGIFLADSPTDSYKPMAFIGPVMSYYEKTTGNFDRLTDERWAEIVNNNGLPDRPDWVNLYLADMWGETMAAGRVLPNKIFTNIIDPQNNIPEGFYLAQNYPNPFNPETTIRFSLSKPAFVTIEIYNSLGQRIKTLVNRQRAAGYYSAEWNGKNSLGHNAGSGIYFYSIKAGDYRAVKKMILLR